jgi:PKD repeat protein
MRALFFILLTVCYSLTSFGQSILYSENFNGGSNAFMLNTTDTGSINTGSNKWLINGTFAGGNTGYVCFGNATILLIPSTPQEPSGITGSPASKYLHICSNVAANAGVSNCNLIPGDNGQCVPLEKYFSQMDSDISTLSDTGVRINFWYVALGSATTYGLVHYSTDGGITWTALPTHYYGQSGWTQASIASPAFDNQAHLRFAFQFYNDANFSFATNPNEDPFAIDDISVTAYHLVAARPTAAFTVSDTIGCPGNCFVFTDVSSNFPSSRSWSFPGGRPSTASTSPVTVCYDSAGAHAVSLIVTNSMGADTVTRTRTVTIGSRPHATISQNGDTLIASPAGLNYQWALYGFAISGATSQWYIPTVGGQYKVIVTNAAGCRDTSVAYQYTPAVFTAVIGYGDTAPCEGGCVTLTDQSTGGTVSSRMWYFPGGNPPTATGSPVTVCYATHGQYSVYLRSNSASGTDSTSFVNLVDVYAKPHAQITRSGDTLTASPAGLSYQWYRNGTSLSGATAQRYVALSTATYSVVTTGAHGCRDSTSVHYTTGVNDVAPYSFTIRPNPFDAQLVVEMEGVNAAEVTIYSIEGKALLNQSISSAINTIDTKSMSNGVYIVRVKSTAGESIIKLMKTNQ